MASAMFVFILAGLISGRTGVLDPENANEARLNRLQPPAQVMDAVGIEPGMNVAEIGAGRGRFVVHLAVRVGKTGRIFAEDIHSPSLDHLRQRCKRWGLDQVTVIHGEENDPKLPENTLDLIFIISSYHHFADPEKLLGRARSALKPDGRLAIVEWLPFENSQETYPAPEELKAGMKAAGYRFLKTDPLLQKNNLMIYLFSR
jgi:ubiquinone/menaquinone biosynthesis C-methylase UbiE